VNLDLTSHGSLKLGVPWGSIRLSLRPYGPEGNSQLCTIVICADSPSFQLHPPGRSLHERGLAIDIVSRDPELLGRYWKHYIGGRWSPTDSVHYDLQPWL